jgi:hypothetical protein
MSCTGLISSQIPRGRTVAYESTCVVMKSPPNDGDPNVLMAWGVMRDDESIGRVGGPGVSDGVEEGGHVMRRRREEARSGRGATD